MLQNGRMKQVVEILKIVFVLLGIIAAMGTLQLGPWLTRTEAKETFETKEHSVGVNVNQDTDRTHLKGSIKRIEDSQAEALKKIDRILFKLSVKNKDD